MSKEWKYSIYISRISEKELARREGIYELINHWVQKIWTIEEFCRITQNERNGKVHTVEINTNCKVDSEDIRECFSKNQVLHRRMSGWNIEVIKNYSGRIRKERKHNKKKEENERGEKRILGMRRKIDNKTEKLSNERTIALKKNDLDKDSSRRDTKNTKDEHRMDLRDKINKYSKENKRKDSIKIKPQEWKRINRKEEISNKPKETKELVKMHSQELRERKRRSRDKKTKASHSRKRRKSSEEYHRNSRETKKYKKRDKKEKRKHHRYRSSSEERHYSHSKYKSHSHNSIKIEQIKYQNPENFPVYNIDIDIVSDSKPFIVKNKDHILNEILTIPESTLNSTNLMNWTDIVITHSKHEFTEQEIYESWLIFGDIDKIFYCQYNSNKNCSEGGTIVRFYLVHSAKRMVLNSKNFSINGKKVKIGFGFPHLGILLTMKDKSNYILTPYNWNTISVIFKHKSPKLQETRNIFEQFGTLKAATGCIVDSNNDVAVVHYIEFEENYDKEIGNKYFNAQKSLESWTAESWNAKIAEFKTNYPWVMKMAVEDRNNASILFKNKRSKLHEVKKPKKEKAVFPTNYNYLFQKSILEAQRRYNFDPSLQNWNPMHYFHYGNINLRQEKEIEEQKKLMFQSKTKWYRTKKPKNDKHKQKDSSLDVEDGWNLENKYQTKVENRENYSMELERQKINNEIFENNETDID